MPEEKDHNERSGAARTASSATLKEAPQPTKPRQLPPYKVLLHNDDVNNQEHVVMSILKVTHLSLAQAEHAMLEAHHKGVSLVLVTHKERAELYEEQFRTYNLIVTIEPDA